MDKDLKLALGKILGEIYRLQGRTLKMPAVSEQTVFGLLNGFEETIDQEIGGLKMITQDEVRHVSSVLERYENDPLLLQSLVGYTAVEREMARYGIDWSTAQKIVTLLRHQRKYPKVIQKLTGGTEHGFW